MALNLSANAGGDFVPYLKYNAKAGRWYVKSETLGEVEIQNPRFAIDISNIKTGWVLFSNGGAPVKVWDVNGVRQPKPADIGQSKYKEGFEVLVFGGEPLPALGNEKMGLRELCSSAAALKAPIIAVYNQAMAEQAANPGCVPVVRCTGVTVTKTKEANYEPTLVLEKWVPRLAIPAFDEAASGQRPTASATPPVAPQAAPVPPAPPPSAQAGNPLLNADF